ncbi:MAG: flavodoxin [Methanoregulaceae archaeon PtaB.Bin108]|nr:MAG: flavodoxin [Methanoregulaceae archaeon PtaB.Bin108]
MELCIIYHSYSGITRKMAVKIRDSCGGDLIEVVPLQKYNTLTAYTVGCMRARNQECDPITPDAIDVSHYDLIVLGTPVWMYKPTPAANAAVAALSGCSGKKAVVFATCGGKPGDTIPLLKKALVEKGIDVVGDIVFTKADVDNPEKIQKLLSLVSSAGGLR